MLEAAMGVLEDPRFAAVFGPGGRPEAPVIGRLGADTINGRIDRLVITDTEILIVDYKTDRPPPPRSKASARPMSPRWPPTGPCCHSAGRIVPSGACWSGQMAPFSWKYRPPTSTAHCPRVCA